MRCHRRQHDSTSLRARSQSGRSTIDRFFRRFITIIFIYHCIHSMWTFFRRLLLHRFRPFDARHVELLRLANFIIHSSSTSSSTITDRLHRTFVIASWRQRANERMGDRRVGQPKPHVIFHRTSSVRLLITLIRPSARPPLAIHSAFIRNNDERYFAVCGLSRHTLCMPRSIGCGVANYNNIMYCINCRLGRRPHAAS